MKPKPVKNPLKNFPFFFPSGLARADTCNTIKAQATHNATQDTNRGQADDEKSNLDCDEG